MGVHHARHHDVVGEIEGAIGGDTGHLGGGADLFDDVVADQQGAVSDLPTCIVEGCEQFDVFHQKGGHDICLSKAAQRMSRKYGMPSAAGAAIRRLILCDTITGRMIRAMVPR